MAAPAPIPAGGAGAPAPSSSNNNSNNNNNNNNNNNSNSNYNDTFIHPGLTYREYFEIFTNYKYNGLVPVVYSSRIVQKILDSVLNDFEHTDFDIDKEAKVHEKYINHFFRNDPYGAQVALKEFIEWLSFEDTLCRRALGEQWETEGGVYSVLPFIEAYLDVGAELLPLLEFIQSISVKQGRYEFEDAAERRRELKEELLNDLKNEIRPKLMMKKAWNRRRNAIKAWAKAQENEENEENEAKGQTELYTAAFNGNLAEVNRLIAAGANVNEGNEEDGYTPLIGASYQGHLQIVERLLAAPGIDVNKSDNEGETPLNVASAEGHLQIVERLLTVPGIDVNKSRNNGASPLINAAYDGHISVVERLLAVPGIDLTKRFEGKTALDIAIEKRDENSSDPFLSKIYTSIVEMLRGNKRNNNSRVTNALLTLQNLGYTVGNKKRKSQRRKTHRRRKTRKGQRKNRRATRRSNRNY